MTLTSAAGDCGAEDGRCWQDAESVEVGGEAPSDIVDAEVSATKGRIVSVRISVVLADSGACGDEAVVESDMSEKSWSV